MDVHENGEGHVNRKATKSVFSLHDRNIAYYMLLSYVMTQVPKGEIGFGSWCQCICAVLFAYCRSHWYSCFFLSFADWKILENYTTFQTWKVLKTAQRFEYLCNLPLSKDFAQCWKSCSLLWINMIIIVYTYLNAWLPSLLSYRSFLRVKLQGFLL